MARKGLIQRDKTRLKVIKKFTLRAIGNGSDGGPKGPPLKVNGKVNPKVKSISLDLSLDKIKLIDEEEKKVEKKEEKKVEPKKKEKDVEEQTKEQEDHLTQDDKPIYEYIFLEEKEDKEEEE